MLVTTAKPLHHSSEQIASAGFRSSGRSCKFEVISVHYRFGWVIELVWWTTRAEVKYSLGEELFTSE